MRISNSFHKLCLNMFLKNTRLDDSINIRIFDNGGAMLKVVELLDRHYSER